MTPPTCACHRFDLIVASWTMLHLVDPMGTLMQLHALLAPGGVLLCNYCYAHIAKGEKEQFRELMARVSMLGHAVWLGEDDTVCLVRGRGEGQQQQQQLELPINYTHGTVQNVWRTVQPQYCIAHYEFVPGKEGGNAEPVHWAKGLLPFLEQHCQKRGPQ